MRMKVENEGWEWRLRMKVRIVNECWEWRLRMKVRIVNEGWEWRLRMKVRIVNECWEWRLRMKPAMRIVDLQFQHSHLSARCTKNLDFQFCSLKQSQLCLRLMPCNFHHKVQKIHLFSSIWNQQHSRYGITNYKFTAFFEITTIPPQHNCSGCVVFSQSRCPKFPDINNLQICSLAHPSNEPFVRTQS